MRRQSEGAWPPQQQQPAPPARLPADHVLFSGAVLFPGAFDQLGSPLLVFPADAQASLSTSLSKAEAVDFVNYCLSQHGKTQKSGLVSVVADLREASAASARFIAETLLLLEQQKRTVHTAYIIKPKRKDVLRLLCKLWDQSKQPTAFKKVFLKEVYELSNYVDRSQLTASLGGYLVYCHQSWALFTKELAAFQEHFECVLERLPGCVYSLQALSTLPLPSSLPELQLLCSTNEARFQELQRELGLDDVLRHCKRLLEKLRSPDLDPHFQAMAATALFSLHFSSMLQNHRRITAAVQKVELLWEEVFSKALLQLRVLQMREAALQITEQIESLLQHKLQPYNIQMARDAAEAERLSSEFHSSVYTPAMSLVVAAEEVVQTLGELLSDAPSRERWLLDLSRLKDKLHSTVTLTLQTLQAVAKYHRFYNKAHRWYQLVLSENFLQDLFSEVGGQRRSWGTLPPWRRRLSAFLKNHPPTNMEELVHLANLSQVIPDKQLQQEGRQLSSRCITLRHVVLSSDPLTVAQLQAPLQWQYELLQSKRPTNAQSALSTQEAIPRPAVMAEGKPSSLSSFDSGFEGAGSMLDGHTVTLDFVKQTLNQPQIQEETTSNLSDSGGGESIGNSSKPSIHIVPKVIPNPLDFEIEVKRSAPHPTNPWLSLPDDDLENLYAVAFTPKQSVEQRDSCLISNSHETPAAPLSLGLEDPRLGLEDPRLGLEDPRLGLEDPRLGLEDPRLGLEDPRLGLEGPRLGLEGPRLGLEDSRLGLEDSRLSLEDSELNPIAQVLSSTATDPKDHAPGAPSMLWDSYDLHGYLEATECANTTPTKDWDIKEEENLVEVEKTLERTDKILTEEECVLAQEVQLNVLLQTEEGPDPWMAWNNQMSLDEVSETNVVDHHQLSESQFDTDYRAQPGAWRAQSELLTEIKGVHILDQKIFEENFKINLLKQEVCMEESVQRNSDRLNGQNVEMQTAKEKLEQENVETEHLNVNKCNQNCTAGVIGCSIMTRTECEEDGDMCNEINSSHSHSQLSQSKEDLGHSCCDPPQDKAVSRTILYNETDLKFQDTCHPPDPPVPLNTVDLSTNSVQPSSDLSVTPNSAAEVTHPIPKPRMNMHSLKKLTEQCSTQTTNRGIVPPVGTVGTVDTVDTVDTCAPCVNVEEVSAPTSDSVKPKGAPTVDAGGGGAPTGDIIDMAESLLLGPDVELCTNNDNDNNNNNNWLQLEGENGETHSTDKDPDQQMEDKATLCDAPVTPPHDLEMREVMWSEGTKMSAPIIQDQLSISTTLPSDFGTSIVLDTGSGLMKAGFADEDLPSILFPTIIGVPKYEEIMNGSSEKDTYVGNEAQQMRGVLALRHPIKHGVICNWDDMERIWQHTFDLLCVNPGEHPVLLTEAPMIPLENRQRSVEIMFELFGVPYSYVAMQAVLALYAAGRTTGVVLDSGDGLSHSVPVYEGYVLPHAVQRFPLAGADVTAHLTKLLQEQGVCMRTTAEQEIVREIKEKCCCVALNYDLELHEGVSCGKESYTMPDGRTLILDSERIRAPEILFKPELIGRDHYGLHESMYKSILSSDIDLRRDFLGNILLSGGNTLLPGLPERLEAELSALVPCDSRVRVSSPSDRDFSVWCGGAVLANLPSFCGLWISQSEYEEYGPQIVHRKCF